MGRLKDRGGTGAAKLQKQFKMLSDFFTQIQEGNYCFLLYSFDHKSVKSARIELRFCTLRDLNKLNTFCLDRFARYHRKKCTFL